MKFEGAPTPEATPEEVAEHLKKQSNGGLNGLAEKLKDIEVTVIKSTEAPEEVSEERSSEEKEKIEKVNEAFLSSFEETKPEPVVEVEKEIAPVSKETQEYVDSRRIGIENDEMLTRRQKDSFLKMTDELEAIEKDFRTKKLSSEELKKHRGRKKDLKRRLTTGKERGTTKEQIEAAEERAKTAQPETPAVETNQEPEVVVSEKQEAEKTPESKTDTKEAKKEKASKTPRKRTPKKAKEPTKEPESLEANTVSEIPTPEAIEARKVANEILETVPDKEKPGFLKKIVGAGFFIQEWKNRFFADYFEQIYTHSIFRDGHYTKIENPSFKEKIDLNIGLFIKSRARSYRREAKKSKEDRLALYEGKNKVKAALGLASGGILGMRILAGPMGMLSRLPAIAITSLSQIAEGVKDVHFDKKMLAVSEGEAAEEAWALYEDAQKDAQARGERVASFDDLSRVYGKGVVKESLEAGNGITSSIALRKGINKLVKPLEEKLKNIELDTTLSAREKQSRTNKLIHTNERLIKDLDRLVDNAGNIDAVGYHMRQVGVWSKRIGHLVALESLAELGFHGIEGFMGHSGVIPNDPLGFPSHTPVLHHETDVLTERGHEISTQDFENTQPWEGETPVEHTTETIKKGGNLWRAAKAIQDKLDMDNVAYAEAWENSTVTLPDGHEVPLAELHLVHEGDTLSFVDGKFVFENGSGIPHAEHITHALEANQIESVALEDTDRLNSFSLESGGSEFEPDAVGYEDSPYHSEWEQNNTTATTPQEFLSEQIVNPEYITYEMNRDLRALFGTLEENRSEWTQWKTMATKKFMQKMEFPDGTPAKHLQRYLSMLSRDAEIRPKGGFFQREESIEAFIKRALTIVIQREKTQ